LAPAPFLPLTHVPISATNRATKTTVGNNEENNDGVVHALGTCGPPVTMRKCHALRNRRGARTPGPGRRVRG